MGAMHEDPIFCRAMLYGLLEGCPLENELDSCQLKNIRSMGWAEQMAWVNTLSDKQCLVLFRHHLDCLNL